MKFGSFFSPSGSLVAAGADPDGSRKRIGSAFGRFDPSMAELGNEVNSGNARQTRDRGRSRTSLDEREISAEAETKPTQRRTTQK